MYVSLGERDSYTFRHFAQWLWACQTVDRFGHSLFVSIYAIPVF